MKLLEVSSTEMLVFITDSFTCIWYSMNSNGRELEQIRIDTSNIAPERLAERVCLTRIPALTPDYLLTSQWIPVLAPIYALPFPVRIPVYTAPKCGTEPIRYVTLHLRNRRWSALLRYRNCAEIIVLVCEQKPYTI